MYIFEEGDKERGQLGLGDRRNIQQFEALPINLAEGYHIETVESGGQHTVVTAKNAQGEQKVYGCGSNYEGELGLGARGRIKQFEESTINLEAGYHIERVECGRGYIIVLATNAEGEHKLYGCGWNEGGQLGMGGSRNIQQFEALPINLAEGYRIERVECGDKHTIVTVKNAEGGQKLYGCGSNAKGQLGLGNRKEIKHFEALPINMAGDYKIERVEYGYEHTIVTAKNSQGEQKLYGCGSNKYGQLDMGDRVSVK